MSISKEAMQELAQPNLNPLEKRPISQNALDVDSMTSDVKHSVAPFKDTSGWTQSTKDRWESIANGAVINRRIELASAPSVIEEQSENGFPTPETDSSDRLGRIKDALKGPKAIKLAGATGSFAATVVPIGSIDIDQQRVLDAVAEDVPAVVHIFNADSDSQDASPSPSTSPEPSATPDNSGDTQIGIEIDPNSDYARLLEVVNLEERSWIDAPTVFSDMKLLYKDHKDERKRITEEIGDPLEIIKKVQIELKKKNKKKRDVEVIAKGFEILASSYEVSDNSRLWLDLSSDYLYITEGKIGEEEYRGELLKIVEKYAPISNQIPRITDDESNDLTEDGQVDTLPEQTIGLKIDPQPRLDYEELSGILNKKYGEGEIEIDYDTFKEDIIKFYEANPEIRNNVIEALGDPEAVFNACAKELSKAIKNNRKGENCVPGYAILVYTLGITGDETIKQSIVNYVGLVKDKVSNNFELYNSLMLSQFKDEVFPGLFIEETP